MKQGWHNKTIGTLCQEGGGNIQTGPFGSQLHQSDYSEHGTPVVMPADIPTGKISTRRIARVAETHVQRLSRHKLRKGDIVYGRRGDIGRQALAREENVGWLCGTGCLRIRLEHSEVCPEYLHRYLSMPEIIGWIEGQAIGATMPNLNTNILSRVLVYFPSLNAQRKIAAILTAYDDLIETNKRRIALLEKMAEELYCEWFVRMRFPGYQNTKFVKGVPEGWKQQKFDEIYNIKYGKTLSTTELIPQGKYEVYGAGDIIGYYNSSNCEERSTLITCRGNGSGTVWRTKSSPCFITNNSFIITPNNPDSIRHYYFIFLHLRHAPIEQALGGSAQPQITIDSLSKISIFDFPSELIKKFSSIIEPLDTQLINLNSQIECLAQTRDLLLPRLISGKLSVEDLDIQLPPSMREEAG